MKPKGRFHESQGDHRKNKRDWNDHADLWIGTAALPVYGVRFPMEDELHLFGDVTHKKMLEKTLSPLIQRSVSMVSLFYI